MSKEGLDYAGAQRMVGEFLALVVRLLANGGDDDGGSGGGDGGGGGRVGGLLVEIMMLR